jgi:hypothetical protein
MIMDKNPPIEKHEIADEKSSAAESGKKCRVAFTKLV